jgi:ABC-type phosphate transport system substrate-binding protein
MVIVNSANPLESLDRDALRRLFLKQSRNWPDGEEAHPVDQSAASAVREAFSKVVLRQPMAAVNAYWQRQILAGRANPPQVKQSDTEILDFVAADAQAVGYVAPVALLPSGVKVLELTDSDGGDGAGSDGGLGDLR